MLILKILSEAPRPLGGGRGYCSLFCDTHALKPAATIGRPTIVNIALFPKRGPGGMPASPTRESVAELIIAAPYCASPSSGAASAAETDKPSAPPEARQRWNSPMEVCGAE